MFFFKRISNTDYEELIADAKVLKYRANKPTIMLTQDGRIVKHIYKRTRRKLSSSRLLPYAGRFIRSSKRLAKLGIPAPTVLDSFYYPTKSCHLVIYRHIPGENLLELAKTGNTKPLENLPKIIAKLHALGIYFRDLHSSNFIAQPNGELALVDIESIKFKYAPLDAKARTKNLHHLFTTKEDSKLINKTDFMTKYLKFHRGSDPS